MNTIFQIGSLSEGASKTLLLEIGDSFCIETYLSTVDKTVEAVSVYTFEAIDFENSMQQILDKQTAAGSYQQVVVSSAFPQALLTPRKLHQRDSMLLESVYDGHRWHQLQDDLHEWQIINAYSIPDVLYRLITQKFPSVTFIHTYSAALKIYNGFASDKQIAAHFISNQFRVLVKKDQRVQLVQTYNYTSPMDVVYFLLKICTEFGMTQEDTQLIVSGFIEERSALYKELYNYFLNIHFSNTATVALPTHEYPSHFFTSVHNLAACVL